MKRLLGYLKEHLCVTILAPLFKMLEASFELFVPLVVASMIDVGIGHHDIGYLWKMGGLLILLGIIGFSFSITAQYFAARSAVYTGKSMRFICTYESIFLSGDRSGWDINVDQPHE